MYIKFRLIILFVFFISNHVFSKPIKGKLVLIANNYTAINKYKINIYFNGKVIMKDSIKNSTCYFTFKIPKEDFITIELVDRGSKASTTIFTDTNTIFLKMFEENGVGIQNINSQNKVFKLYNDLIKKSETKYPFAAYEYRNEIDSIMTLRTMFLKAYVLKNKNNVLGIYLLSKLLYENSITNKEKLSLFQNQHPIYKNSYTGKLLKATLDGFMQNEIKSTLQPFSLKNIHNQLIHSNRFKDKIILIDFWASWCSPCRENIPALKLIYDKYKNSNFEIIGISLDEKIDNWKKALNDEKLVWINLIDNTNNSFNATAKKYNIQEIPRYFLIGKDGKIISNDIKLEEIEEKLKILLNN